MKKLSFLVAVGLFIGLMAFTSIKDGGIIGKVSPADSATQALAVKGTDTLITPIVNGNFVFVNVKPGTYTVWVKAKLPYKDAAVENVAVIDSTVTDVGQITLIQ